MTQAGVDSGSVESSATASGRGPDGAAITVDRLTIADPMWTGAGTAFTCAASSLVPNTRPEPHLQRHPRTLASNETPEARPGVFRSP